MGSLSKGPSEINELAAQITSDACAAFIEKASAAFLELHNSIGSLPEMVVVQWNAQLEAIRAAVTENPQTYPASLAGEMRILANKLEVTESMYPEQAPGTPHPELARACELMREIAAICHQLRQRRLT